MTQSPPKGPASNTIILGIRISLYELVEDADIQTIALLLVEIATRTTSDLLRQITTF